MKIALLSDIHSNIHALEACLAHAERQEPDQFAFLGDLVGYGAAPALVVDLIMMHAQRGAWVIQGNHDEMAFNPHGQQTHTEGSIGSAWTRNQLSLVQLNFLRQLPLMVEHEGSLFVHASAKHPQHWDYIDSERRAGQCIDAAETQFKAQRVFVGHVHHQTLYYRGANQKMMRFVPTPGVAIPLTRQRPIVVTVGSVGQPRDGDTRAMYAVYDNTQNTLIFHRVPYHFSDAAHQIRQAGLPEKLAKRIEHGR